MWTLWLVTSISVTGALVGTYLAKLWVKTGNPWLLLGVVFGAIVTWVGWVTSLRFERLVVVEGLWAVMSLILTIAMGFALFHERVSLQEGIGIALAVLAVILLAIKF